MRIKFQRELFSDVIDELIPLVLAHYEEIAVYKDRILLDIDFKLYMQMEQAEKFIVFTARDGEQMVGYSAFFWGPSPHYRNTLYAVNDVVFVKPEYRGNTGTTLAAFCEDQLKAMGTQVITYHVKTAFDWSPALVKLGYESVEKILIKWVGE